MQEKISAKLIDQHGRLHNYLRISMTEQCNLRCTYCMPADRVKTKIRPGVMTQKEILDIASIFVKLGVNKIRLTGGEPLVRKDAGAIIKALGKLPVELTITTNGILIDQYVDVFSKSGIHAVNVSLDSLNPNKQIKIVGRDYFDRIMSNIKLLMDRGFHVKINMVVMKGVNHDELEEFINWTRNSPIHVRFIEFMPFFGNQWKLDKGVYLSEMLDRIHASYGTQTILHLKGHPNDTARNFRVKNHLGTFAIISSVTHPFCHTCNRIRLTADGKIKNCLFSNSENDLLSLLRQGKSIESLIRSSIRDKKAIRGGNSSIESFLKKPRDQNDRSMVAIGG